MSERERDLWRSEKESFGRACLLIGAILSILAFVAILGGWGLR